MTAQVPEKLIYQGKTYSLCEVPLNCALSSIRISHSFSAPSTALWRGYVGTWTIEQDRLYLTDITGHVVRGEQWHQLGMVQIFPEFPNGLFAHWYTGELRVPIGRLLSYRHSGFASTYEFDLFLRFDRGVFQDRRMITNGIGDPKQKSGYQIGALTTIGSDHYE